MHEDNLSYAEEVKKELAVVLNEADIAYHFSQLTPRFEALFFLRFHCCAVVLKINFSSVFLLFFSSCSRSEILH